MLTSQTPAAQETAARLIAIARNPVPSGAVVGTFDSIDGQSLRFARWSATSGPRRGTVCCFPGRSEFIEKYFETIADLRRRGFAVAICDWRGQGGSQRPLANRNKGWVRDFAEYDRDLMAFMREIVLPDCPPPYIALAHSMGGHILLRNSISPGSWFERMVITAPMLRLHDRRVGPLPQWATRTFASSANALGFGRVYPPGTRGDSGHEDSGVFEGNALTSDQERFHRNRLLMEAAPELQLGGATIGWVDAAYRSMALLNDPDFISRVQVPLLLFVAGRDTIVSPRAIEDFAARLKIGTHVLLPTARHEVLQETDDIRSQFWAAFDAYTGVT